MWLAPEVNEWHTNEINEDLGLQEFDRVVKEVTGNKSRLDELLGNHKLILNDIDSIIFKLKRKREDISFGEIMFETPSATAWEAAKLTNAVK